ncbi:flagellar protein FlaG [Clostridium peptidivorans]|uniref:flagellar protein FlaG n=1 Tax=Clostridium peptidivorans TaxID=100174 RepID=UPI000BE357E0|nr:flagellar protein FlaG [Clostridium peptidivorans]
MDVKVLSQGRQMDFDISLKSSDAGNANKNTNHQEIKSNLEKEINLSDVEKAAEKLNKLFEDKNTHVEYELYGRSKSMTIKIVNNTTREIIKEVPPKKLIDMVDKLCELAGLFMDEKA